MAFDLDTLKILEAKLSADGGVPTTDLEDMLTTAFGDDHSDKDKDDYRLGTRPWKKFRDEVVPVNNFLQYNNMEGRVRFPLDSHIPDAWFTPIGRAPIGIEVTRALGRVDFELAKEMVRDGIGRGFLGIKDDKPPEENDDVSKDRFVGLQDTSSPEQFERALSQQRSVFNTEHAKDTMKEAISISLGKKNSDKYTGMWLLIVAPLLPLTSKYWDSIVPELIQLATPLPFEQIHVIGEIRHPPSGFQIK